MGFVPLMLAGISAPYIFLLGDCFQVVWVYTRPNSTEMINLKAVRDWPVSQFIRKSMRSHALIF